MLIHKLWPRDQVIFRGQDVLTVYQYLLLTSRAQEENIRRVAEYRANKSIIGEATLHDNTDKDLRLSPYQKVGALCALNSEAFFLHMQQGTGKTPTAISVMCNDAIRQRRKPNYTRMYRALVVAPKNVRTNWVTEIEKFAIIPGKTTVLRGGQIERTRQLIGALAPSNGEQYTAVIISYETMTRMLEQLKLIEWDLGILDEQHYCAAPTTKRTVASLNLRDVCNRRLGLTGTPLRNSTLDLFAQFEFLGKGWSGFSTWKNFKQFYGVFEETQNGSRVIGTQNLPMIRERLARTAFSISLKEAMPDLPDTTTDIVEVEMSDEQANAYKQLAETLAFEIENELSNNGNRTMVVQNSLVKLLRLAQITSGFITFDAILDDCTGEIVEPKLLQFFKANPKLETLVKLLKGGVDSNGDETFAPKTSNDKTIVWACWTCDINAIKDRLDLEGIKSVVYTGKTNEVDRAAAIAAFNEDRETTVFIGNAGAGGTGVNLLGYPPGAPDGYETNANHVIYYSQDWSQVKRSQSAARCHRRGTREPVRVTDLCVPGTIDEEIRARVMSKAKAGLELSDIRKILKTVLTGIVTDD
jgi:SNF2 family DNA or RNA helicase